MRPIVTKFGTLIENMSRTGLYDLPYFIDNFRRVITFGMGVVHVSQIFDKYFL